MKRERPSCLLAPHGGSSRGLRKGRKHLLRNNLNIYCICIYIYNNLTETSQEEAPNPSSVSVLAEDGESGEQPLRYTWLSRNRHTLAPANTLIFIIPVKRGMEGFTQPGAGCKCGCIMLTVKHDVQLC